MWHRHALGKSPLGEIEVKGRKLAPKADQVGGEQGVVGKSVADPGQPFEIKAPASHLSVHRRQSSGGRRDDRWVGGLSGTKAIPLETPVGAAGTDQKRRHTRVAVTGAQAKIQTPNKRAPARLPCGVGRRWPNHAGSVTSDKIGATAAELPTIAKKCKVSKLLGANRSTTPESRAA